MAIGSPQWMYASGEDAFTIDQSLRFNDDDSAYLSTTLGTATHNDRLTFSCWVKRSAISENHKILTRYTDSDNRFYIGIASNDKIYIYQRNGGSLGFSYQTTQLFRDPSAWMHIVLAIDTGQGTPSDRVRLYVNGVEVTDFSTETDPTQDLDLIMQTATSTEIRLGQYDSSQYFDGYLSEVHFIDGTALTPSSFGETGDYGEWKPIEVSGLTYGTNGFYLDFADSSALGDDESGNTNDWTVNNLTASDQVVDSPTNNFATLSIIEGINGELTFSEGNLQIYRASVGSPFPGGQSNMSTGTSGKWYWEVYLVSTTNNYERIGIVTEDHPASTYLTDDTYGGKGWGWEYSGNKTSTDNGDETYGSDPTFATGEIVGVAVDVDNGTLTFYQDNVSRGVAFTGLTSQAPFRARNDSYNTSKHFYNFGQDSSFGGNKTSQSNQDSNGIGDFYYEPPNGFLALCSKNLPDVDVVPSEHFNTVLYTGTDDTGSGHSITGVGFEPSFVWTKDRDAAYGHYLFDAVRGTGVTKGLRSNTTADEGMANESYDALSSFDSDGFTITGTAFGSLYQDRSSADYVAWNWKANGSGSSNTDGDIDSTVSANVDAGFSIVSYTGSGTGGDTVGHGLSKAPEMIIVKTRNDVEDWGVYHASNTSEPETDRLKLNSTVATADNAGFWNDTAPTSSVFTVGTANTTNWSTKTYIAYCFHSVDGYSKVGSYEGNDSTDGTFVYTGFRPAFIMFKSVDTGDSWVITDTDRDTSNDGVTQKLYPNGSFEEQTASNFIVDHLSNGFKLRQTSNQINNASTYIYLAFAETPFKYSNAR
jgi:hypothetical protein